MEWEKRFANYISEKGQIPRLYEGQNSTAKKVNSLIKKEEKKGSAKCNATITITENKCLNSRVL